MKLTTAGNLEGISRIRILYTERYIGLLLTHQTVTDMTGSHELTLLTGERGVIDDEIHRDRRLRNLLERNRGCLAGDDRITYVEILDTGNRNDLTAAGLIDINSCETVKGVELRDTYTGTLVRIVVVHDVGLLIQLQGTVIDLTDTDTSDELVVINSRHQHLRIRIRIALRCRDIIEDGLEQWLHGGGIIIEASLRKALLRGCIQERAVELLVGSIEIHHQLENLILDLGRTCLRLIDLVDHDHNRKTKVQGLLQYETGLWHRSLEGIDQEDRTIYHLENTLYLTTEISVARGIDDVDLRALIVNGCVLRENGDTSLTLDRVRVHDTDAHLLVITEYTGLL